MPIAQIVRPYVGNHQVYRHTFDHIRKDLGIGQHEDWYGVSGKDVVKVGGKTAQKALREFGTLGRVLQFVYPEQEWIPWRFKESRVPKHFWNSKENQRQFMDKAGKILGVTNYEQWYQVKSSQVEQLGGHSLLSEQYSSSLFKALCSIYPEYPWRPWLFQYAKTPSGYWHPDQVRTFFEAIAPSLQVKQLSDWYQITPEQVSSFGGAPVLAEYGHSLASAVMEAFPDYHWLPWKFSRVPGGYWTNVANQRKYFDWFASTQNFASHEDWYRTTSEKVRDNYGGGLLYTKYRNSLYKALITVYPEYEWLPWKFEQVPKGFWNSEENVVKYLKWLSEQLGVTRFEDWMTIPRSYLASLRSSVLLRRYGGLLPLLQKYYPGISKDILNYNKMFKSKTKSQKLLLNAVQDLFPDTEIRPDFRHGELVFRNTNREMELDIYIPQLRLAFEYQGEQHYFFSPFFGTSDIQQSRDIEKRTACATAKITLVEVPFWWDKSKESLQSTIHKLRPDVFPKPTRVPAIPENMPMKIRNIRNRSDARYAEYEMLIIQKYLPSESLRVLDCMICTDDTQYGLYDIRCYWDGKDRFVLDLHSKYQSVTVTRSGEGTTEFPKHPLDGFLRPSKLTLESEEGRRDYEAWLHSFVKGVPLWNQTTFVVHDIPSQPHLTFQLRYKAIQEILPQDIFQRQHTLPNQTKIMLASYRQFQTKEQLLQHIASLQSPSVVLKKLALYNDTSSWLSIDNFAQATGIVDQIDSTCIHARLAKGGTVQIRSNQRNEFAVGDTLLFQHWNEFEKSFVTGHRVGLPGWFSSSQLEKLPFRIAWGFSVGALARCRGCLNMIERSQPRIEVRGAYTHPQKPQEPIPLIIRLCFKYECIEKAQARYSTKIHTGVHFPPFQKKVMLTKKLREKLLQNDTTKQQMQCMEEKGMVWVE